MLPFKVLCSNVGSTRRTLTRLAGALARGEIEADELPRARVLLDTLRATLRAHEVEAAAKMSKRMDSIEARLTGAGR